LYPHIALIAVKVLLPPIERIDRCAHNIRKRFLFIGVTPDQQTVLRFLQDMMNLRFPPMPDQLKPSLDRCRELGIAEWRIKTALTRKS
jgi:hypothetical protein